MSSYKIYPTLLDSFEWWRGAETEEDAKQREAELVAKLNREYQEPSYAASRGTALNNCVDAVLQGTKVDVPLERLECDASESGVYRDGTPEVPVLYTFVDGFKFVFSEELVLSIADHVGDAVVQPLLVATLDTCYGEVELYGFADYINVDTIIDLKSTNDYTVGKYRDHWQHRVYPLLAVRSGMMERVACFEYLVAELRSGKEPLDGTLYREQYHADVAVSENELRDMLETEFLPWLEAHREQITNNKIFGGEG